MRIGDKKTAGKQTDQSNCAYVCNSQSEVLGTGERKTEKKERKYQRQKQKAGTGK